MTSGHTAYEDLASQRRNSNGYRQGHAEAQRAYLIGKAIRDRRLALGLSQVELATRAAMTQPALSRLEAGGVIPTIPLLDRISVASTPTSSSRSRRTLRSRPVRRRCRSALVERAHGHAVVRMCNSRSRAVVEVSSEGCVAPSSHFPAEFRVGRPQPFTVKLRAGVVETWDTAPDVSGRGGRAFGLHRQIPDDADALARLGMLQRYPS